MSVCTVIPTAVASINVTTLVQALAAPHTVQVAAQSSIERHEPIPPSPDVVGRAPFLAAPANGDPASPATHNVPFTGTARTLVIDYPQSVGPIIASGPRTRAVLSTEFDDDTKERAVQQNLAVMTVIAGLDANSPFVVYTGDAQSSGGSGVPEGGTELAGPPNPDGPVIVLVSDPRGPCSIRAWLETIPLVSALLRSLGRGEVPPRTERPVETPRSDDDTRGEPVNAEPPRGRPIEPNTDTRDTGSGDTTSDAETDAETARDSAEPRQVDRETLPDTEARSDTDTPTERGDDTGSVSGAESDVSEPGDSGDSESSDPPGDQSSDSDDVESGDRSESDGSGSESSDSIA
ncbi:hypothetical protein [Gordonia sp. NPDC058843]|uniref:hypothetical protein n=1 Tax=Gordonia sp. NPDC058843 TaxID=3346648 RepID=UPI0036B56B9B